MCQSLHFRSWSWSFRCLMWRLSPAATMTPWWSTMPVTITPPLWPCFVVPVRCRLRTPREIRCLSCKSVQSRHMSLMVPQITGNSTILVQQRVHNINKNIKVTLYGPCVWEPTGDLWNPPVIGGFPSQLEFDKIWYKFFSHDHYRLHLSMFDCNYCPVSSLYAYVELFPCDNN